MGDLFLNKVIGSLLAVALVIFVIGELSHLLFAGDHAYVDEEAPLSEQLAERFAYFMEMDTAAAPASAEAEETFDLGLALANADLTRGERDFRAQCSTCHTVEQGGAHGTGPNLWDTVNLPIAGHEGFNYSNALTSMDGRWTYENLDAWIANPSAFAPGTSMSFAGIRRDDRRANVIAYLAQYTDDRPPFPEPAPAESEDAVPTSEAGEPVDPELPTGGGDAISDPDEARGEVATQDYVLGTSEDDDAGEVELIPEDTEQVIEEIGEEDDEPGSDGQ